jgi:peptidoglycan hydrolase-like protein with peptidoglycan-binding domain
MGKAITLGLLCSLAGSVIAYGFASRISPYQHHRAPQQGGAVLGDKEGGTLLAIGSGAWRVAPRANAPSGTERTFATEVVIVPAVKVPRFEQKTIPLPGDQGSLAQQLQRELARVGCYDGQINGVWTTSTRQAMKAFLERVNATLPIHQPDGILLALVQSQRVATCGASCPSGQGLTDDGRCIPTAILSREALKEPKKAILATSSWSTTTTLAPNLTSSSIEGKMALAGPKAEGSAGVLKTEPIQPTRDRPPMPRLSGGRDWRSELWKRLPN